jgi:hypothetical protein
MSYFPLAKDKPITQYKLIDIIPFEEEILFLYQDIFFVQRRFIVTIPTGLILYIG